MYTDSLITSLITCPKIVKDPPKDIKETRGGFSKKAFSFISVDGMYNFNEFVTQNNTFPENFSIGLIYMPKEEKNSIVLLRCNGPHGGTKIAHHAQCHIHTATAERINNGLKPEGHIELTDRYATKEDALQYYIKHIGLVQVDRLKHFPITVQQLNLFQSLDINLNNGSNN